MNAESTPFAYDDFEQYLLEAARIDRAPADLPARLGVALGIGVPILVATEMASVVPTTTSLASGAVAAPNGLLAAVKASLGIGSSTLWSTAAKGIAVGVLSGAALVGTGQALVKISGPSPEVRQTSAQRSVASRAATSFPARAQATPASEAPALMPAPEDPVLDSPLTDSTTGKTADDSSVEAGHASSKRRIAAANILDRAMVPATTLGDAADKTVTRRLPRPVFPEKTTAIARYPLVFDDVSALYDAPKKVVVLPAAPAVEPSAAMDPAELRAMRSKTIAHCRTLLGQSKAAQALAEVDGFRKRVGSRYFGVDELLLRIEALAMLGRAKEAQADVANVERLAPNSAALRQAQLLARSRFVR